MLLLALALRQEKVHSSFILNGESIIASCWIIMPQAVYWPLLPLNVRSKSGIYKMHLSCTCAAESGTQMMLNLVGWWMRYL